MGHHSHLEIAGHPFLSCRDGYLEDLAALFTESDRRVVHHGAQGTEFVYATTVTSVRERLQVQGLTAGQCRRDLTEALKVWALAQQLADGSASAPRIQNTEGKASDRPTAKPKTVREWRNQRPAPTSWTARVPNAKEIEDEVRRRLARCWDDLSFEEMAALPSPDPLYTLSWYMSYRSLTRLLLELAPDEHAEVCLNLSELTGCCVELDADLPVAGETRAEQLADLAQNAPLLVITEGVTDSRLLSAGMEVTHPHLKGYVNFFDYAGGGAEGVAAVAKTVSAFVAAGVANRFIALADNDTEGHDGLRKLKQQNLPDRCRIMHYPRLPLLEAYPTMGPTSERPVLADVNELAGSLEMYLGRDVLMGDDNSLMPVQWRSWNPRMRRYQGTLLDPDKKTAQDRFMEKVKSCRAGQGTDQEDWSGIRAIIDTIVTAFE